MPLPVVLVTVGTDHHPFDRLVDWSDAYALMRSGSVRVVVQHGSSRPPRHAEGVELVPRETLLELMSEATVVVAQGGPGSILDARKCSHVPVVVPRRASLGEVVDDHQVAFCSAMAALDRVTVVGDDQELHRLLDDALATPHSVRRPPDPSPAPATARRVRDALGAARTRRPGFVSIGRVLEVLRPTKRG